MSWQCSGTSNNDLVENMYRAHLIKSASCLEAMKKVDRAHFAPKNAYSDAPQSIGYNATISAPHMHAHACEEMSGFLKPGASILDVGSGSGYLVAVIAHLIQPHGKVVGIEHIQELVDLSIANLRKDPIHSRWLDDGTITIVKGDGRLGNEGTAPYDAIHVGAAAKSIHEPLVEQLKSPGRLFIPVDDYHNGRSGGGQHIWHVTKDEKGEVTREKKYGVFYVPLTDNQFE